MKPKIIIVAAANNFNFIKDLVPALSDSFDIKMMDNKDITPGDQWRELTSADLIWLEWADGDSLNLLNILYQSKSFLNTKVILRLHRYELFTPRTIDFISEMSPRAFEKIDRLVFVSEYVKQIGIKKFPWMDQSVVVPNLLDTDKFPLKDDHSPGYNILMLGRMSYVKNLPLALTMFHELMKIDRNYKLHVVGEIHEPELEYYINNYFKKTGLYESITFHGRLERGDVVSFMQKMHYILSTSIFESQGMGILEGMSCGLKPVVFDFPGAEYIFPDKWRFIDRTGFIDNILSPEMLVRPYREFVLKNYSIKNNIGLYRKLIQDTLDGTKSGDVSQTQGYVNAIKGDCSK